MDTLKFSIIVPVYNVEKYLNKCLDSVIHQTYDIFEAIIVCDDSTDKSNEIVDSYVKKDKRLRKIYEKNTGLAKAKNLGLDVATGDYLLFLDGDDYIENDLLQKLIDENIEKYDLLRFQAREILNNKTLNEYYETPFVSDDGVDAFSKILKYHYIENSWLYAYKRSLIKENDFKFHDGCIAEDYGLTPLIIASAKKIKSINYIGYNYVQRENSLMNNNNYEKKLKKMNDMLKQASDMKLILNTIPNSSSIISFLNNSIIYYSTRLKYKDYKKIDKILKQRNCFSHLKGTNLKDKVRCFLIKHNSYIFFRYIKRG